MLTRRTGRLVAVVLLSLSPSFPVAAQSSASVMAQMIPLITRAAPTATRGSLTEGYVSQPAVMGWLTSGALRGQATLNLEGLTLERGELTTGAYGEGYVDRRHPHAYVHEAMIGVEGSRFETSASLFAGRGFAPFGSDDPMVRPFVKYPVNHHLTQVLERLVAIGAVRYGRVIAEAGVFNGDEPLAPGVPPQVDRFGDSWSGRLTLLPTDALELAASLANVDSPEQPSGHGLDQRKADVVARYSALHGATATYALAEWAVTSERDRGRTVATLRSALVEAAACRGPIMLAARVEQTDRAEEETLIDPFRVARPASDLNSLGVSRWRTVTASATWAGRRGKTALVAPFIEVARVGARPGDPAGIFDPELRYGARTMWVYSLGLRLRTGMHHPRMGRYGVALPAPTSMSMGTMMHGAGSEMSSMAQPSALSCPF